MTSKNVGHCQEIALERVPILFMQPVLRRMRRGKGWLGLGGRALEVALRALQKNDVHSRITISQERSVLLDISRSEQISNENYKALPEGEIVPGGPYMIVH